MCFLDSTGYKIRDVTTIQRLFLRCGSATRRSCMWDGCCNDIISIRLQFYALSNKHRSSTLHTASCSIMRLLQVSTVHVLFVAFALSQSLPTINLGYEIHQAIALNVPNHPNAQTLISTNMRVR